MIAILGELPINEGKHCHQASGHLWHSKKGVESGSRTQSNKSKNIKNKTKYCTKQNGYWFVKEILKEPFRQIFKKTTNLVNKQRDEDVSNTRGPTSVKEDYHTKKFFNEKFPGFWEENGQHI